jgi:hypothetical protein
MALTLKVVLIQSLPGNMLAMVYKGGPYCTSLLGLLLMVVVFSFERYADFKRLVQETLINS